MPASDKHILLDIGRVIFHFDPYLTYKELGFSLDKKEFQDLYMKVIRFPCYEAFEKGRISFKEFSESFPVINYSNGRY